jgi:hypothetical protein
MLRAIGSWQAPLTHAENAPSRASPQAFAVYSLLTITRQNRGMELEHKLLVGLFGSFFATAVALAAVQVFVAAMNAPFVGLAPV